MARYRGKVSRIYFRADADFADPGVCQDIEGEGIRYAVRPGALRRDPFRVAVRVEQRKRRINVAGGFAQIAKLALALFDLAIQSSASLAQSGDCGLGMAGVEEVRIEVFAGPLAHFVAPFVLGIVESLNRLGVVPVAADSSGGQRPTASVRRG